MPEAEILVAEKEGVVALRVVGRATFKLCRKLRDFGAKAVQKETCRGVIVDFSKCTGMDSTFMGVLAMIGLQGKGRCSLVVVNTNADLRALLDGIGVSRIWTCTDQPVDDLTWSGMCSAASGTADMTQLADVVLKAHETLMELHEDNVPKFRNLVELLAKEMDKNQPPEGN